MILNRNTNETLEQIYDFIRERPQFSKKPELEKVIAFFTEIHDNRETELKYEFPHKIIGNFGFPLIISIHDIPNFNDKERFIHWVLAKI